MKKLISILLLCFVILFIVSCEKDDINSYEFNTPELADDGWEVGSVSDAGISSVVLSDMMNYINNTSGHNIHNILIFKDDKLVFEEYFDGYLYSNNPPGANGDFITYDKETDHYLASVSKTITSVIFGAAVKEGFIENIDDKVVDIFPEYDNILVGEKAEITLKHLLTMSSGLAWDESSTSLEDPMNDVRALIDSDDPIAYTLSRTLLYQPGTQFLYNSGGTNVLGAVIEKTTDMNLLAFGNKYLFDTLNIQGGTLYRLPSGYYFVSGGFSFRPRELAKFGYLFLNNGYWEDIQVVTEDWIAESVEEHIETQGRSLPLATGYGYQWWLQNYHVNGKTYESYFAAGWGDQYMIIFPDENMMVVFNGGNYLSGGSISPFSLVENYILESLQ